MAGLAGEDKAARREPKFSRSRVNLGEGRMVKIALLQYASMQMIGERICCAGRHGQHARRGSGIRVQPSPVSLCVVERPVPTIY
jgi:hypothetical protein